MDRRSFVVLGGKGLIGLTAVAMGLAVTKAEAKQGATPSIGPRVGPR